MTTIVRKFHWMGVMAELKSVADSADTAQYILKVSCLFMQTLPGCQEKLLTQLARSNHLKQILIQQATDKLLTSYWQLLTSYCQLPTSY